MMRFVEENGVTSALEIHEFGAGKPVITFTAGVHGDEVTGVYTARRLIEYLEKHPPLCGTVRVLPVVNPTAMRALARRSPFDKADMNRIFPGDAKGSISERVAFAVWEETASADALIDLHCCSQYLLPYLLATYEEDDRALDHARRVTMPIAIRSEGTRGQLFVEACKARGQRACIIELPSGTSGGAVNKPASDLCVDALLDFLRSYNMAEGSVRGKVPAFYGGLEDVEAPAAGLWQPALKVGVQVKKGETLGTLGGSPVPAPKDALLMAIRPMSYLFEGDLWAATYACRKSLE